jgi:hypothetical protein
VRRLALGAATLILFVRANTTEATDAKTCPPKALASVDLDIAGPTSVPATFKGQPVWMMLQMDAALTLIHQDATDTLQLPTRSLGKDGFEFVLGGRHVTQMASFDPLLIGGLRIPRTEFFVDPFPHTSPLFEGRPVAGTLAMDLLWPYDFDLDLAHRKLSFYSPTSCAGRAVYWAEHYGRIPMDLTAVGNIYFTVEIDGVKLEASIATSADNSQISIEAARKLSTLNELGSDAVSSPAAGEALTKVIKLASGNLVIPARIQLTSVPRICELSNVGRPDGALGYDGCYGRYPLVLGRNALQKLHLYFATKEKVIYFTVADVQ